MEQRDIEAAKRLKNRMWAPALMEFYEAADVVRYFREVRILRNKAALYHKDLIIIPAEKFFSPKVLEEGLLLIDENLKE